MPVLKDFRELKEIRLPITGGKVWIYTCLLAQDSMAIDQVYVSDTEVSVDPQKQQASSLSLRASKYYEALDLTLEKMVAKWDFTDEKEKPLEPTPGNIKKLPKQDFEYLQREIEKVISGQALKEEVKKN